MLLLLILKIIAWGLYLAGGLSMLKTMPAPKPLRTSFATFLFYGVVFFTVLAWPIFVFFVMVFYPPKKES